MPTPLPALLDGPPTLQALDGGGMTGDDRIRRAIDLDDLDELRRFADAGSNEAVQALVEIAGERGDIAELRRLAAAGSADAAAVLADLSD
jgi:hypothetical protein